MKVLFDSNVPIASIIETHSKNEIAIKWLTKVKEKEIEGAVSAHSLAEIYSTLTTLPIYPRISANLAYKLISHNILPYFEVIELNKNDYQIVLANLAKNKIVGGTTYDALIAHAAFKMKADKLFTFNPKHFKRAYPTISDIIKEPN